MHPISSDRIRLLGAIRGIEKESDNQIVKKILKDIKDDDKNHFLSICQITPNKVAFAQSKDFKFSQRVSTTLSRYIRRQLNISDKQMSDFELQNFSTSVTSRIMKKKSFKDVIKILRGQDILDFYVEANAKTPSCMTGANNTNKIRMYAENPNKICLVTSQNVGRALLWIGDDGTKFLDFIYPGTFAPSGKLIEDWVKNRGYHYRTGPYCNLPESQKPLIKVTVKTTEQYPRLDTLYNVILDEANKTAILHNKLVKGVNCIMNAIDGRYHNRY
jgi:hypothetical protein